MKPGDQSSRIFRMNHGTFFFNQKEIFIPLQYSEATFRDSVNKQAKPEPNHLKTLPDRSMGLIARSSLTKLPCSPVHARNKECLICSVSQ